MLPSDCARPTPIYRTCFHVFVRSGQSWLYRLYWRPGWVRFGCNIGGRKGANLECLDWINYIRLYTCIHAQMRGNRVMKGQPAKYNFVYYINWMQWSLFVILYLANLLHFFTIQRFIYLSTLRFMFYDLKSIVFAHSITPYSLFPIPGFCFPFDSYLKMS